MKTNEEPRMRAGGWGFMVWFLRTLSHPIFSPEADERRFLAGLPIVLFVVLVPWGRGWLQFLGLNPVLVIFALWLLAYVIQFRTRLQKRGELKRASIASAAWVALLLGVSWY